MENPFSAIDQRLSNLESLMLELFNKFQTSVNSWADKPLNVEEASEFLSIPKNTLYGLTSRNKIPFCKPAKHLLFFKEELLEWVKDHRYNTVAEIQAAARKGVRRA